MPNGGMGTKRSEINFEKHLAKKGSRCAAIELYLIYLEIALSNKRRSKKTWRIWMLLAADWRRK